MVVLFLFFVFAFIYLFIYLLIDRKAALVNVDHLNIRSLLGQGEIEADWLRMCAVLKGTHVKPLEASFIHCESHCLFGSSKNISLHHFQSVGWRNNQFSKQEVRINLCTNSLQGIVISRKVYKTNSANLGKKWGRPFEWRFSIQIGFISDWKTAP